MYSDTEAQGQEIDQLLDDLRAALKRVKSFNSAERRERLHDCVLVIQQLQTAREAYMLELRGLPEDEVPIAKAALDDRMQIFKSLLQEYEYKKSEINKEELALAEDPNNFNEYSNPDQMDQQQLINYGDHVQDQTQDSINRMKKMVDESEEIGQATLVKMDEQTQKMQAIHGDLEDVQDNVQRAKGTVSQLGRNACGDPCLMIECGCVVVFLITAIVLIIVR